jgi:hypothetical protein
MIKSWEKFRMIDQGNGTYVIQTTSGWFVGWKFGTSDHISSRIRHPDTASSIGHAAMFE